MERLTEIILTALPLYVTTADQTLFWTLPITIDLGSPSAFLAGISKSVRISPDPLSFYKINLVFSQVSCAFLFVKLEFHTGI